MEKSMGTRGQMSEAVSTGIFLTLSGGFQDAYTYYCRGNVFANAQTGNIVLMGSHLAAMEPGCAVSGSCSGLCRRRVYGGACETASPAGQKVPLEAADCGY